MIDTTQKPVRGTIEFSVIPAVVIQAGNRSGIQAQMSASPPTFKTDDERDIFLLKEAERTSEGTVSLESLIDELGIRDELSH